MQLIGIIGGILSFFIALFSLSAPILEHHAASQSAAAVLGESTQGQENTESFATAIPNSKTSEEIKLVFVGDIMLSRHIGKIMDIENNWRYPFEHVRDFLRNADLTFGNLEGPISGRGKNQGSIYSFNADPYAVSGLIDAGFDVLSVANNHILDYGPQALIDTLAVLNISGISAVGGGEDYKSAHTAVIKTVGGVNIAFLGYTNLLPRRAGVEDAAPAISYLDEETMKHDIGIAKLKADVVIVSFHWGEEYQTKHNAWQERIAHEAIDAGASLVIGHHPHVVQEVEAYNGGYIAYSLGNFIFDQNFSEDTGKGLVFEAIIKDKKVNRVETSAVSFNEQFQPVLLPWYFYLFK